MVSFLENLPIISNIFKKAAPEPVADIPVLAPKPLLKPKFIISLPLEEDFTELESLLNDKYEKQDFLILKDPKLKKIELYILKTESLDLRNTERPLDKDFKDQNYKTIQFNKSNNLSKIIDQKISQANIEFEKNKSEDIRKQIKNLSTKPELKLSKEQIQQAKKETLAILNSGHGPNCNCPLHGGASQISEKTWDDVTNNDTNQNINKTPESELNTFNSYSLKNKLSKRLEEARLYFDSIQHMPNQCSTHDKIIENKNKVFIIREKNEKSIILVSEKKSENKFETRAYALKDYFKTENPKLLGVFTHTFPELHAEFHGEVEPAKALQKLDTILNAEKKSQPKNQKTTLKPNNTDNEKLNLYQKIRTPSHRRANRRV